MKHIFIVNPTSAKGKALTISKAIEACCKENKLDYKILYTKEPGEATKMAQYFNTSFANIIYSVGGDGTLFEVVNGMAKENRALLSVVPAGSGNDFYRTIQDKKEPFFDVDIGQVNDSYFINSASIGLDAEVANNIAKMKQLRLPSSMIYKASILYSYFKYHPYNITTILNDKINAKFVTLFAICNGRYYGGGFPIAPFAQIDDGKFDIYEVEQLSKLQIPFMLAKLSKGTHTEASCVHHYQSNMLSLHSDKELTCNLDGEIIKGKQFVFKLSPQKITLCEGHPAIKKLVKEQFRKH